MNTLHYVPHADAVRRMDTDELRHSFLLTTLFQPEQIVLRMLDLDRAVVGGVTPLSSSLVLSAPPELDAEFFTQRRELGLLNVGGPGRIVVEGQPYAMAPRDGLYIGRGSRNIEFASDDASNPAAFYLISYPAHAAHPTAHIARAQADTVELGSAEAANHRRICKYFHPDGVPTAQLVMGVTELSPGSVWNTMPPHTHVRRSELYLYFDLPSDAAVFHFLGQPDELRTVVARNRDVVVSPGWSIHAGCGTARYSFCWAMGGENQSFADMQGVPLSALR